MANSKSAMKRIRQNAIRRERNRLVRSRLRTVVKKFDTALEGDDKKLVQETFLQAVSALDRAANKGVIPRKRAARKKGRLTTRLDKALA